MIGTPAALKHVSGDDAPRIILPVANAADWERQISQIDRMIAQQSIDSLVVALPLPSGEDGEAALGRIIALHGTVSLIDTQAPHPHAAQLAVSLEDRLRIAIKASIDRVGAAMLLLALMPVLLLVAVLIRLTSAGPALFVQPRLGQNNRVIPVVKFRTMYHDRQDRAGGNRTIPNDPRVTPVGRVLRRWSVDELPQLLNVLVGNMSLVGPRPHAVMMKAGERLYFEALPNYLSRHAVKPGITGWAQVNRLSGQIDSLRAGHHRLTYDLHYIENWSLWLDLKIVFKTSTVFFDRVNRY